MGIMWLKQCHKPPMTVNGNHTMFKESDWGMVQMTLYCPHVEAILLQGGTPPVMFVALYSPLTSSIYPLVN